MKWLINLLNIIKEYLKRRTVPLEVHVKVLEENILLTDENKILKSDNMLLERKVIALEKDIEFNTREKLIDQGMIVDLLAYTNIPTKKRKIIEDKVDKQKAFIRKYYGRKHPDHKYNPASIENNEEDK